MNRLSIVIFGILIVATSALAQSQEDSWDNLQRLRPGEKIQVVDQKLKSQEGVFLSYSVQDISLRVDQDAVSIDRGEVLRVSALKHKSRGKHALIGLAVGAGGGLGVGLGLGSMFTESGEGLKNPAFVPGFVVLGSGIGAGIGAAMPAGRPTIYRAERRQSPSSP